jgi:hypothetical protein
MSKKKDTHILKIFPELSQLIGGECMHQRSATPTAELVSQNMDGVGVDCSGTWMKLEWDF